jgi:erythromycin esterase
VPAPPSHDLSWLQANMIPFRTDEPSGDYADLMPLKEIIGNARVVALGEGTHGTREFFRMKHRLLEFLVQEMGFDHFAIEAAWAESNRVDGYVREGIGDPHRLLSGLYFWTWNTQEVLDMILWMRGHNTAHPDGIRFLGFDMQFSTAAMDDVVAFLNRVDPAALVMAGPAYSCWRVWERALTYSTTAASTREECRAGVEAVYAHLAARRSDYEAASSRADYEHALRAARIAVQDEHMSSRRWVGTEPSPRDRYMAENAAWILDQAGPESKIVLWAHNGHVMDAAPAMGGYLREVYGADMVVVGFSFHDGQFNAYPLASGVVSGPLGAHTSHVALPGSYEYYFQQLDQPRFMLDLRPLRGEIADAATWLRGPLPVRMIGAVYDPRQHDRFYWDLPLHQRFDVWIQFGTTQASQLLPFVTD